MFRKRATGDFGNLAKAYDATRPSYPAKIIQRITKRIGRNALVLDVGCGTGISTRQMAQAMDGIVVGCDIDPKMIEVAIQRPQERTTYIKGRAEKLPFKSKIFDAVTIFTAFHWFSRPKDIRELMRVLKEGGSLFVVHVQHISSQKKNYRAILEKELGKSLPRPFQGIADPEVPLREASLHIQKRIAIKYVVKYALSDYLQLLQSYSYWNYVPKNRQKTVLRKLESHYRADLKQGYIHDELEAIMLEVTK